MEEDHAHCEIPRTEDGKRTTGGPIPDLYEEVHLILTGARKILAELEASYRPKASILHAAKALVFQVGGYCRKADALREERMKPGRRRRSRKSGRQSPRSLQKTSRGSWPETRRSGKLRKRRRESEN